MEGLENKLEGVHVGDMLLLNGKHHSVVGYVQEFRDNQVKLSTQQSYKLKEKEARIKELKLVSATPTTVFSGDRTYKLKYFHDYQVLNTKQKE